jgi:hypothetical protein
MDSSVRVPELAGANSTKPAPFFLISLQSIILKFIGSKSSPPSKLPFGGTTAPCAGILLSYEPMRTSVVLKADQLVSWSSSDLTVLPYTEKTLFHSLPVIGKNKCSTEIKQLKNSFFVERSSTTECSRHPPPQKKWNKFCTI